MTLFSSMNIGLSALLANQSAMQTAGHNIANANTPGFSRQRVLLSPQLPQTLGFGQIGRGVVIERIERIVDDVTTGRLRLATSLFHNLKKQDELFQRLEAVFNELNDTALSTTIGQFFDGLEDLSVRPQDMATRRTVLELAQTLSGQIRDLGDNLRRTRQQVDDQIQPLADDINRIGRNIADLNVAITNAENGGIDLDAANDLRDQRDQLIKELAEITKVNVIEASNGAANVLIGSSYLVFDKFFSPVITTEVNDGQNTITTIRFEDTGVQVGTDGGKLQGLIESRDDILIRFRNDVDRLAKALIFEFNKVHAQGIGLDHRSDLTSGSTVLSAALGPAPIARRGTITDAVTSVSFTDTALIGFANDFFNGTDVLVTSGPNEGQRRRVVDFDGATGLVVFDQPFDFDLDPGVNFQLTSLSHPIQNGSFDIRVANELTKTTTSINITVDLDQIGADSTLTSIVGEINADLAAAGFPITASVTSDNRLRLVSSDPNITFSFANDSSDFLGAIGMNAFFTGANARSMEVRQDLLNNPRFLAAAQSLNGGDNTNVAAMLRLRDAKTLQEGSATFEEFYQGLVGTLGIQAQTATDRLENQETLTTQLEAERERISGVNLDEEATNLITFQRAFEASARYIRAIDEALQSLIALV